MKSKFTIIFSFLCIFAATFLLTDVLYEKLLIPFDNILESTTSTENEKFYKISVFNGKIAVFEGDSKLPYKVYDTYINSLPDEDRINLEKGIRVNTSSELIKIIEEYTS